MKTITAPEGYEGVRFFDDGIREWRAAARPTGAKWWTNVDAGCGHQHLSEADLNARAEQHIALAVTQGRVK